MIIVLEMNPLWLAVMWLGLFVFGLGFNGVVGWMEMHLPGGHTGFTALLVVVGVAVTVTATAPFIGIQDYLVMVLAFLASGIPMISGSIGRYLAERSGRLTALHDEVREQLQ